jgi:RNA polymerase sigma-70 factor (ECF subfamily)
MSQSIFTDYRQFLFPIAYNMLGSVSDAEDLVQETMLKWLSKKPEGIENKRGYLVKTLINKCLNFIRDRKKETTSDFEIAPELLTDHLPSYIENSETLSLGVLAMLEKLSPIERAVFLLKEVFGYSHKEIADMLNITEVYCRQILTRARKHMKTDKQRFEVNPRYHTQLYTTFIEVCRGENLSDLLRILREDIDLDISRPAARLTGRLAVGEYLLAQFRLGYRYELLWLKGLPAIVAYLYHYPVRVIRLEGNGEEITEIRIQELKPEVQRAAAL